MKKGYVFGIMGTVIAVGGILLNNILNPETFEQREQNFIEATRIVNEEAK